MQFGRFDTEEDVMRYMIDPFPWLLMAIFDLDQKHSIAGSVATTVSESVTEGATTTDGEGTGHSSEGAKSGKRSVATSGDESKGNDKSLDNKSSDNKQGAAKPKRAKAPNKKAD